MNNDPENINVNLSIGFTDFSGKPILTDISIPVVIPSDDYTFVRILNDLSFILNDTDLSPEINRGDIQKVVTEVKLNLKLKKDKIRVNKPGTHRFYTVWHSIARTEIKEGDTFYAILNRQPISSRLPGDPVISEEDEEEDEEEDDDKNPSPQDKQ